MKVTITNYAPTYRANVLASLFGIDLSEARQLKKAGVTGVVLDLDKDLAELLIDSRLAQPTDSTQEVTNGDPGSL